MTATYAEARDSIIGVFKSAWDPTTYFATYDDVAGDPPDTVVPWARVTLRHLTGNQASLGNANGQRRWERNGILTIQIFTPVGDGLSISDSLAKIVSDAFEGGSTSNGVWFRNVRVNEIGSSGDYWQTNVLIDFTYDEIK